LAKQWISVTLVPLIIFLMARRCTHNYSFPIKRQEINVVAVFS